MFIVFNKEQVYSYIIVISMVLVIFFIAKYISNTKKDTVITCTLNKILSINNVEIEEK